MLFVASFQQGLDISRFNPYFGPYGFGRWPGRLTHNAFNHSQVEPYTGMLDISDYIRDLQYPHLLSLAIDYETEIMVCQFECQHSFLMTVEVV